MTIASVLFSLQIDFFTLMLNLPSFFSFSQVELCLTIKVGALASVLFMFIASIAQIRA